VRNFKQISVDQSSDEPRSFALKEHVADVVAKLGPSPRQAPRRIEVLGDDGVVFDSYPGAIAQIVTTLTMNALLHAVRAGLASA